MQWKYLGGFQRGLPSRLFQEQTGHKESPLFVRQQFLCSHSEEKRNQDITEKKNINTQKSRIYPAFLVQIIDKNRKRTHNKYGQLYNVTDTS